MSLGDALQRLRHVPAKDLAPIFLRKTSSKVTAIVERFTSRPQAPTNVGEKRRAKTLGLFHKDVFAPGFAELFRERFPGDAKALMSEAEAALGGVIDVLGSGPVNAARYPGDESKLLWKWQCDLKSGHEWQKNRFFKDIVIAEAPGADIKVPWEISRGTHFLRWGQAYRLTGEERFARAFVRQWDDWFEENPPKYGVNWACPMDVALRAANWIAAREFFAGSAALTDEFEQRFAQSLFDHGRHIIRHREWHGAVSTNHYLANLLGLFYIGSALGIDRWRTFAFQHARREILRQTHDDGMDFEASTAYHRLSFEIFFFMAHAALRERLRDDPALSPQKALEEILGEAFHNRLRGMVRFLGDVMGTDGRVPLIGDNDSGRVHALLTRADNDWCAVLQLGALFFKDPMLKRDDVDGGSESLWLFGFSGWGTWTALPGRTHAIWGSRAPGPSGLAVLRGETDFAVVSAQPNGTLGTSNHTHNDKLALTLSVGRDAFLADPGCGAYTSDPAARNAFRSTRHHSTVMIDGEEQNRFRPGALFALENDATCAVHVWDPLRVEASHTGYTRLSGNPLHRRTFERAQSGIAWRLDDRFEGAGQHVLLWSFVCGPAIRAFLESEQRVRLEGEVGNLFLEAIGTLAPFRIETAVFSPAYGVIRETACVRMDVNATLPFEVRFQLSWGPKS